MLDVEKIKCVKCGKQAKYKHFFTEHISPLCRECAEEEAKKIGEEKHRDPKDVELGDYYSAIIPNPYPGTEMVGLENVENIKELIK